MCHRNVSRLFLATLIVTCVFTMTYEKVGHLLKVHASHLDNFLMEHPNTLYLLLNETEGDEKILEVFHKLQFELERRNYPVALVYSTLRQSSSLRSRWQRHHTPLIRLFIGDGVYDDFHGKIELERLEHWVRRIMDAPTRPIKIESALEIERFKKEEFAMYLRFPKENEDLLRVMTKFIQVSPELNVYYTTEPELDAYDIKDPAKLILGFRRPFDEGDRYIASEDKIDQHLLINFFYHLRTPHLKSLTDKDFNEITGTKIRSIILFDDENSSGLRADFRRVAAYMREGLHFFHTKSDDKNFEALAQYAKVDPTKLPQIRIVDNLYDQDRVFEVIAKDLFQLEAEIKKFNAQKAVEMDEEL